MPGILSVPYLALQQILEFLDPFELFFLANCSAKAAKRLGLVNAKLSISFKDYSVKINGLVFITERMDSELIFRTFGFFNFGGHTVKYAMGSDNEFFTFWDDPFYGLTTIFFYLAQLFNCEIISVKSNKLAPSDYFHTVMDYVISRQKTIQTLWISGEKITPDYIDFIMRNLRVEEDLSIFSPMSGNFNGFTSPKLIAIGYSSWVTLGILLSMKNAVSITLETSSITNEEINRFFLEWRCGKMPSLKFLSIGGVNLTNELHIDGLDELVGTDDHSAMVLSKCMHIEKYVTIRRNDGTMFYLRFYADAGIIRLMA